MANHGNIWEVLVHQEYIVAIVLESVIFPRKHLLSPVILQVKPELSTWCSSAIDITVLVHSECVNPIINHPQVIPKSSPPFWVLCLRYPPSLATPPAPPRPRLAHRVRARCRRSRSGAWRAPRWATLAGPAAAHPPPMPATWETAGMGMEGAPSCMCIYIYIYIFICVDM